MDAQTGAGGFLGLHGSTQQIASSVDLNRHLRIQLCLSLRFHHGAGGCLLQLSSMLQTAPIVGVALRMWGPLARVKTGASGCQHQHGSTSQVALAAETHKARQDEQWLQNLLHHGASGFRCHHRGMSQTAKGTTGPTLLQTWVARAACHGAGGCQREPGNTQQTAKSARLVVVR